jgi:hypothetical protein
MSRIHARTWGNVGQGRPANELIGELSEPLQHAARPAFGHAKNSKESARSTWLRQGRSEATRRVRLR